ncbi:MAG: hypothetical protein R6T99_03610 [Bacteroidales bacterium]
MDELKTFSIPTQDNPLMDASEPKGLPVPALDVWKHAYSKDKTDFRIISMASMICSRLITSGGARRMM